ncbi:MAG: hypothetical protein WCO35_03285 [Candidatus Nomurabacteria bacterium]
MVIKKLSLEQLCAILKITNDEKEISDLNSLIFKKAKKDQYTLKELTSLILSVGHFDKPQRAFGVIETIFKLNLTEDLCLRESLNKIFKESKNQRIIEKTMEELAKYKPKHPNFGKIAFFQAIAIKNNGDGEETSNQAHWAAETALVHLCNLYKIQNEKTDDKVKVRNFLRIHHYGIYDKTRYKAWMFCIDNNLLIKANFMTKVNYADNFGIDIEIPDEY